MMRKILKSALVLFIIASISNVEAAPAYSWDLPRDMMTGMTTNPFGGVWTAMYDAGGLSHGHAN